MHPKNKYQGSYDFEELLRTLPELKSAILKNPRGEDTIQFSDPKSVKLLNKALLKNYYGIDYWDVPNGYLVPPIPSRSDYIHHVAELIPPKESQNIKMMDIGTGANLIYPIVAIASYGWSVIGTDIDPIAIKHAKDILINNPSLSNHCKLRQQTNSKYILKGMIHPGEYYDLVVCNPPFHSSQAKAQKAASRKRKNLNYKKNSKDLNFGGQSNELWYPGGELAFLKRYIRESKTYGSQLGWCTSLVSSHRHLVTLKQLLQELRAQQTKIISMKHGQKDTSVLCWRY